MKSSLHRFITIGIALCALAVCACTTVGAQASARASVSVSAPEWLTDLDASYSPNRYLAFLGQGTDLETARNDALTQFSRFFGVTIDVLTEGSKLLSANDKGERLETKLAETVKIRSNQDLFAVRYSDSYKNEKNVWVVAFSTKKELAENLAETAESLGGRLTEILDGIKTAENGAVRLARAATANALLAQIETVLKKLVLVDADRGRELKKKLPLDKAFSAWDSAKRAVRFNVVVEGDTDGRQAAKVRSLLSGEGFATDPKGTVAIKGSLDYKDLSMISGVKTVEWTFVLSLGDEKGQELVTSQKTGRRSGTTRDSAILQANLEFEKFATTEFIGAFRDYLASKAVPN